MLLDLNLPSGSGIKVLQMIKNEMPGVVAVVLTNYAFPQYRKKCAEAGAYAFLDKSTDFNKVPQLLSELSKSGGHPAGTRPILDSIDQSEPKAKVGSR